MGRDPKRLGDRARATLVRAAKNRYIAVQRSLLRGAIPGMVIARAGAACRRPSPRLFGFLGEPGFEPGLPRP